MYKAKGAQSPGDTSTGHTRIHRLTANIHKHRHTYTICTSGLCLLLPLSLWSLFNFISLWTFFNVSFSIPVLKSSSSFLTVFLIDPSLCSYLPVTNSTPKNNLWGFFYSIKICHSSVLNCVFQGPQMQPKVKARKQSSLPHRFKKWIVNNTRTVLHEASSKSGGIT